MDDTVAVALEIRPDETGRYREAPSFRKSRLLRVRREELILYFVNDLSVIHIPRFCRLNVGQFLL